jgi:hypothetical protein
VRVIARRRPTAAAFLARYVLVLRPVEPFIDVSPVGAG